MTNSAAIGQYNYCAVRLPWKLWLTFNYTNQLREYASVHWPLGVLDFCCFNFILKEILDINNVRDAVAVLKENKFTQAFLLECFCGFLSTLELQNSLYLFVIILLWFNYYDDR